MGTSRAPVRVVWEPQCMRPSTGSAPGTLATTTTTCPATGCGSTGTPLSSGSTGAQMSPTTIVDRTVSPTFSTEMSSLVSTVPSIGTTGTAMSLKTSSAKLSSTRLYVCYRLDYQPTDFSELTT